MPDDSTYQKYYDALQHAYGKDGVVEKGAFNLGYDDFKSKLTNQGYAQKIYNALDQAYGNKGVAEKGAFTLPFNDFYSKLNASTSSTAVQPPTVSTTTAPPTSSIQMPNMRMQNASESTKAPSINIPTLTGKTTEQVHAEKTQEATNDLVSNFNAHKDQAINKILAQDLASKQNRINSAFRDGQIDEKSFHEQNKQLFNEAINPSISINNFKQDLSNDPSKVRKVTAQIIKDHPEEAKKLKAAQYLFDSQDRSNKAAKILENTSNIESGKNDYDVQKGLLLKPEGFFESLGRGFSERNRMMKDYSTYTSESPQTIINKLETQRNSYDPDVPANSPDGIGGHLGQAIGSQGIITAKGAAAGALTSLVPAVGEAAAPWVSAAVTSPEFYKTGYVSSLENEYHDLRNKGVSPEEALTRAKEKAEFDAKVDVTQGIIGTAIGTRMGLKPSAGAMEFSPTFQKTITNLAKHSGQWLAETGVEGGANALLAGGLQELKNIHAGKEPSSGALDAEMGQLMFTYGLGALTKAGKALLNPKAYRSVLSTLAKAPDEQVSASLAGMVNHGDITPEDATDVHSQLSKQREIESKIPDGIGNSTERGKIQDLISKRDELDAKLESSDKAYHPELKEQIKAINEQISQIGREPSEEPKTAHPEPTFNSPEDQAKLYINDQIQKGNKEWTKNDVYVNMAKENSNGFLKFIADQASGEVNGISTRSQTEETFGKELVNKALGHHGIKPEEIDKPVETPISQPEVSSFLESRHANTIDDETGKVSGPNDKPLSEGGRKDANKLADEVEEKGVTKIITSGLERSKETGKIVSERTGATTESRPELNTWDIGEFDKVPDSEFKKAQEYFVKHPDSKEFEGRKVNESFNEYKDRIIKARTELENEPASTLVVNHSNNMTLWDAFVKNGHQWNEQAVKDYLTAKTPEPATLQNNVSYPKISNVKLKENAIQERRPEEVLQREPVNDGETGSGRERMEPSEQGNESAGESKSGASQEGENTKGEENVDELPFGRLPVGIAHDLQVDRARAELDVSPPERGEGITLNQSIERGKELLSGGTDIDKIITDFQKDKKVSADNMAVVRARYNELAHDTNQAYDKFGKDSQEAKSAFEQERKFYTDVVKPMQTEWSKIGVAQQGAIDLDTGSVMGLRRAFQEVTGEDFSKQQEAKAKELSDKVTELTEQQKELKDKLSKLLKGKQEKPKEEKNIKQASKELAKKIRDNGKLNRPGMFSAASPASLVWDTAVEIVASTIEGGGALAQAISDGLAHIRSSDWYKSLADEDKQQAEEQFIDWHESQIEWQEHTVDKLQQQLDELIKNEEKKNKSATKWKDTPEITELRNKIAEQKGKNLAIKLADKTGNVFTPEEAKDIWDHITTNYLDKGTPIDEAIKNTSLDLGLNAEQVINAIGTPKGAREITDEMFKKQYERRKAVNSAKYFVLNANKSSLGKALSKIPTFFFNLKTWGHGTVGNITHAGPNIFRPSVWAAYWPNVVKSFKLAYGKTANYERAMTILKSSPHYDEWIRAGLAADPNKVYDEYQLLGKPQKKTALGKTVQWLNETGTRGFSGLNFMRYDMAELLYNRASDAAKADPDFRKQVAELVNHATGHSEVKTPKALKVIAFAPGLEISRWQRMITDPGRAIKTFATWKSSSPSERAAAKIVAGGGGEKIALYTALLAANAGLLSATHSKQNVNISDPSKADWLRFKFKDKTLDMTGNILSPYRLLGSLVQQAALANWGKKKDMKQKPGDKDANTLTQQARYKLSPVAGTVTDLGVGTDAMGNVLPWSNIKPTSGKHKMTWKELISKEALPIPIAAGLEAYWNSMEKNGMSPSQINGVMNGLLLFGVEGFTGAKLQDDYQLNAKKK